VSATWIGWVLAAAGAEEIPWMQVEVLEVAPGLPEEGCSTRARVVSPGGREDASQPASAATETPPVDAGTMVEVDLAPGAVDAGLPPEWRERLHWDEPFEVSRVPPEPLRGNDADLRAVARVLVDMGRGDRAYRVSAWGASHVAGEFFTGEIRRILQDRYGDAGHGFVMPAPPWTGYRATDLNLCAGGTWAGDFHDRRGGRGDGKHGIAGADVESRDAASFGWVETTRTNPHGRAASRFDVIALRQPGGGNLRVTVSGGAPVSVPTAGETGPVGISVRVPDGPHRFTVDAEGGPVRLLGASVDREAVGVSVDAMGVSGRTASSWLAWDASLFSELLRWHPPDLAILAYGTNEANDRKLDEARYRETLRAVLRRFRAWLPATPCVLIGPSDRAKRVKGTRFVAWGPTEWVGRVQHEVGPEFGCATWNLQAAMGGPGAMLRWRTATPELGTADGIHLSVEGYKEVARRFVAALDGVGR
jgi:lysophospholipase L1-like esterase